MAVTPALREDANHLALGTLHLVDADEGRQQQSAQTTWFQGHRAATTLSSPPDAAYAWSVSSHSMVPADDAFIYHPSSRMVRSAVDRTDRKLCCRTRGGCRPHHVSRVQRGPQHRGADIVIDGGTIKTS